MKQKLLDSPLKNLAFSALGKVAWPHTESEPFLFLCLSVSKNDKSSCLRRVCYKNTQSFLSMPKIFVDLFDMCSAELIHYNGN